MRLDEMLSHVEKHYHLDFIEYIQMGLASADYMDHLEICEECKIAVRLAAAQHRGIFRCTGMHGSTSDEDKFL